MLETNVESCIEYFNENWHNCREQWVRYSVAKYSYGNYNPVEATNASIKRFIKNNSTFKDFIDNFFIYARQRNEDLRLLLHNDTYKESLHPFADGSPERLYNDILTEVAFRKVHKQLLRRSPMTFLNIDETNTARLIQSGYRVLRVDLLHCECPDFTEKNLPCRHIFAVREKFNNNLFHESLCPVKLTKAFNNTNQKISLNVPKPFSTPSLANDVLSATNFHSVKAPKPLSKPQRCKALKQVASDLVSTGCLVTNETFQKRLKLLKLIRDAWKQNLEFEIDEDLTSQLEQLSLTSTETSRSKVYEVDLSNIIMPVQLKLRGKPKDAFKSTPSRTRSGK